MMNIEVVLLVMRLDAKQYSLYIQQENGNVFISNWAILTNCENIQTFSWCLNDQEIKELFTLAI
jgi:virulence-associated protein VapD